MRISATAPVYKVGAFHLHARRASEYRWVGARFTYSVTRFAGEYWQKRVGCMGFKLEFTQWYIGDTNIEHPPISRGFLPPVGAHLLWETRKVARSYLELMEFCEKFGASTNVRPEMLLVFLRDKQGVMKSNCSSDISPSRTHNRSDRSPGCRLCYVTEQYIPRNSHLKERVRTWR